jgi:hypothetical protein
MGKSSRVDWSAVDWRMQDVAIARLVGVTRERARQARKENGGAVPERKWQRTGVTAAARIAAMSTDGRTAEEVGKAAGCGGGHAAAVMRSLGKGFRRLPRGNARYDWSLMPSDWMSRTDKDMASLVGASSPSVVTQWRIRHGMRKRKGGAS